MIISPQIGLHENVLALDYDSEYANLIVNHNLSYETVSISEESGEKVIQQSNKGLLPSIVERFLKTELLMFILTVIIGYGIGSWVLLAYTKKVSKEIRAKSSFINSVHWTVMIIQFSLFVILLFILFSNTAGFLSPLVFAVSSVAACVILGIISFKFFSWYKLSSNKNLTVLLYGIATVTLAMSIAEDAGTKLLMINVVHEKSPAGAISKSSFLYKPSKKYNAEIEYNVVNPQSTTLYLLPNSNLAIYNYLNSIVLPVGFVFRWIASITLLRAFYHKIAKLPISFWIVLSLTVILYLVGKIPGFTSGESMTGG